MRNNHRINELLLSNVSMKTPRRLLKDDRRITGVGDPKSRGAAPVTGPQISIRGDREQDRALCPIPTPTHPHTLAMSYPSQSVGDILPKQHSFPGIEIRVCYGLDMVQQKVVLMVYSSNCLHLINVASHSTSLYSILGSSDHHHVQRQS